VYATLLDEGTFLCSISTMYRVFWEESEVKERRNQLRHHWHPARQVLASRPNEVWSWDITKLKGPMKWVSFYLYVILDVFSRCVIAWMVAYQESEVLASCRLEPSLKGAAPGSRHQFERVGSFWVDPDSSEGKPGCNRTVTLRIRGSTSRGRSRGQRRLEGSAPLIRRNYAGKKTPPG
jgi:transposase InsO family protein